MILNIFSVFDAQAGAFMTPFFSQTKGLAIRSLQDAVSRENSDFFRHAPDYVLYHLGEYDDSDGSINSLSPAERVISVLELLPSQSEAA